MSTSTKKDIAKDIYPNFLSGMFFKIKTGFDIGATCRLPKIATHRIVFDLQYPFFEENKEEAAELKLSADDGNVEEEEEEEEENRDAGGR